MACGLIISYTSLIKYERQVTSLKKFNYTWGSSFDILSKCQFHFDRYHSHRGYNPNQISSLIQRKANDREKDFHYDLLKLLNF